MESAVSNLCSSGDRVVAVSAGYFGGRWAEILDRFGCEVVKLEYPWGQTPSPVDLEATLSDVGDAKAVFMTQSETSTGVVADIEEMVQICRNASTLSVVDAISGLGSVPLETDAWGIDVVVSGSQKGLMTPPGLAFAVPSAAALEAARSATSPRFYLDWERAIAAQSKGNTAFTPAVSLIFGLDAALELLLKNGLEASWERSRVLGRAARAGVKAMGLDLFSPDNDSSRVVTAMRSPDGVDGQELVAQIQNDSGVTLAGGQGELRGEIVRISHIGFVGIEDVVSALDALELALLSRGADIANGASDAAREAYEGESQGSVHS